MSATPRPEALQCLREVRERVERAGQLLDAREDLAAVRELVVAKRLSRQAATALLAGCLQAAWADAHSHDRPTRERCLDELTRLLEFAWTALCPACRRRGASRLMGAGGFRE